MTRRILSLIFALAMGVLVGCGKEKVSTDGIAVFSAPAETVLARVGERAITVGDFRKRLNFETSVYRLTMMNSKHKPKDAEKRLAGFERSRLRLVLPQLVHVALLDGYLESACGGAAVKDEEAILARSVKKLGAKIGKKGAALAEVAAEIGVEPDYLKKQFLIPPQETKARLCFDPASTNVTEKEIDEGLARLDAYTARAIATNRVMRAACSNAFAAVKSGGDFVAVAKRFGAETPAEETEWGWFSRDDFDMLAKDCPGFAEWAFKAKAGEIGGPFELDDGLSIVKVVGHQEGTERVSMAAEKTEEVQLARINFPIAVENPEPRTREHCREALLDWKARDAQKRLFEKLFKDATIEYPNGMKMNFKRRD